MPETQYLEVQSEATWHADPSAREPWARAAGVANATAISAQTPARPERTARDALAAFMTGNIGLKGAFVKPDGSRHLM